MLLCIPEVLSVWGLDLFAFTVSELLSFFTCQKGTQVLSQICSGQILFFHAAMKETKFQLQVVKQNFRQVL